MTRHVDGPPRALESKDSATVQQPATLSADVPYIPDIHDIRVLYRRAVAYRDALEGRRRLAAAMEPSGFEDPALWESYKKAETVQHDEAQACAIALATVLLGDDWLKEIDARIDAAQVSL